jgi:Zn-dependent protease with chaperone function
MDLPPAGREIAAEALNLDAERPTLVTVVDGGPAARARMVPGDVLVAINGERIPLTRSSEWLANRVYRDGGAPISVQFLRQGKPYTRSVEPVMGCAVPVFLAASQGANALTDGRRIVVFSGVLRLAQTDAELAAVIGHELAHVTMRHVQKGQQNRIAGAFGGFLGGLAMDFKAGLDAGVKGEQASEASHTRDIMQGRAFAMDFEREADYVGLYYIARADYDIAGAERFWRALAEENPRQIVYAGMHPIVPERVILLQKTAQEIAEKKRRNQPLVPELRASRDAVQPTLVRNDQ